MKLVIATLFYEMKAFSEYVSSIIDMTKSLTLAGVSFDYWHLSGDSYVDRGRNTICDKFLKSDATDLIMIDSDMSWSPDAILKILKSPYELTGCAYPTKNNWEKYAVEVNVNPDNTPIVDTATGLISAQWVPCGFIRIKKSCLEKMAAAYPENVYTDPSANPDPNNADTKYNNFFECGVVNGSRVGEDVNFCRKWAATGGKIWIEPRIAFGHFGVKGWYGNFHEYLLGRPKPDNAMGHELRNEVRAIEDKLIAEKGK